MRLFFAPKRRNISDNIQTNTTAQWTSCLQKKIDKTTYLVEIHFSDTSTQSVEDKLMRAILYHLEHGKQRKSRKSDEKKEYILGKYQQGAVTISFDYTRYHAKRNAVF